jgi:hypothetical protein
MRSDFGRFVVCFMLAVLSGCNGVPSNGQSTQGQSIDTIQAGDRQLSCPQLSDQINSLNKIIYQQDTGVGAVGAGTAGSMALDFIPIVGPLIGAGVSLASTSSTTNSLQQSANQKSMAQERKQHLLNLYSKEKC